MSIFGFGTTSWKEMIEKHEKFIAGYGSYSALRKKLDTGGIKLLQIILKDAVFLKTHRALSHRDEEFIDDLIINIKGLGVTV